MTPLSGEKHQLKSLSAHLKRREAGTNQYRVYGVLRGVGERRRRRRREGAGRGPAAAGICEKRKKSQCRKMYVLRSNEMVAAHDFQSTMKQQRTRAPSAQRLFGEICVRGAFCGGMPR